MDAAVAAAWLDFDFLSPPIQADYNYYMRQKYVQPPFYPGYPSCDNLAGRFLAGQLLYSQQPCQV